MPTLVNFLLGPVTRVVLWVAINAYICASTARRLHLRRRGWIVAAAVVLTVAALPLVAANLEYAALTDKPPAWITLSGRLAMGFSFMAVLFVAARDLVALGLRLSGRLLARAPRPRRAVDLARRAFLSRTTDAGVVLAATTLTATGRQLAMEAPTVVRTDVPIAGLHADLIGFTIAQVTDLHVSPTLGRDYVAEVVARTLATRPDLIAVTGDLADGYPVELAADCAPLAALRAPAGVFFVTGNHDYYWDHVAWLAKVRELGMTPLMNEHRVLVRGSASLVLAGVTDRSAAHHAPEQRSDVAGALNGAPRGDVRILLAHQPQSCFAADGHDVDLQISGHTHGGQFFPLTVLIHFVSPYVAGLARRGSGFVYVSRGAGHWGPPIRTGKPAEIALLRLVRA